MKRMWMEKQTIKTSKSINDRCANNFIDFTFSVVGIDDVIVRSIAYADVYFFPI